ncbi:hypothetical protein VPH35_024012 [Triticum aestivum]
MPSRSVLTEGITAALGDHFTVQHTELETALSDHDAFYEGAIAARLTRHHLQRVPHSTEGSRMATVMKITACFCDIWRFLCRMMNSSLEFRRHSLLSRDVDKSINQSIGNCNSNIFGSLD